MSFTFFAMQDIARVLRKIKDNFRTISRRSLVAMASVNSDVTIEGK